MGKLGIGPSQKRTDICDPCYAWDHSLSPRIEGTLREFERILENATPTYFEELGPPPPNRTEDEEYLDASVKQLELHHVKHEELRASLDPAVLAELGITEALACEAINNFLPDVRNYVFPFSLDRFLRDLFRHDVNAPKPSYTYLCADHQDVS